MIRQQVIDRSRYCTCKNNIGSIISSLSNEKIEYTQTIKKHVRPQAEGEQVD